MEAIQLTTGQGIALFLAVAAMVMLWRAKSRRKTKDQRGLGL